jgi:zinc protease
MSRSSRPVRARALTAVLIVTSLIAPPLAAQNAVAPRARAEVAPAAAQKVATVEGITEYRLANGLRVLLFPDASKPTITVNVTYLVGSRHENYGETGMAHLLEHLLFKGTPNNPNIAAEFNKRGMRFNGTTSFDRTNYFELFQADEDNLEWALRMEADRMVNSFVSKEHLDSEMTVVRNEYERGENEPFSVLLKRMQSIAFDWHNYGNSPIGNRSDIENVKIENLRAFYRTYYQPDNAVLLVAGRFDEAKTLALITKYFGAIPKPTRTLPELWTVEPIADGERNFMVRRKGDLQFVAVSYRIPSALHPDSHALRFMNDVLSNTPAGRLHKALVETGKAVQVAGFQLSGVDPGLHVFVAVLKKDEPIEPVQTEMIRIIEEFPANPPTQEEMTRARNTFANQAERVLNNHESIGVQLSEYIARGDWRLFFLDRDAAETVTSEAVKEAAAKYYRRDNRTVGVFVPEDQPLRASLTPAPALAEVMKDFKPKEGTSVAEAFDPTQDNIDKRTKRIEIDGIKVALLPKKNRGETVVVGMRFHSGDEKTLFGQRMVASLTGQMLSRGTTRYTREQLKDELERLKVAGGVNGLSGDFQTTRPNVAAAIRLAAHMMREPAFNESEFEQLKKLFAASLESQRSDPAAVASIALATHFNVVPKGDWRYQPTLEESLAELQRITLDDVKRFHKTFFGANRGEIAVIGDFDEAEVTAAIKEAFAGWKTSAPYERLPMPYRDVPAIEQALETPDKENAVFRARINIEMNENDPDFPALFLANHIMGGGAGFDSRLTTRIRVKDGLSYGVGSSLNVGQIDRAGSWSVQAIAAPQNIEKVAAAFREEVEKALKDGFTEAEVAAAKSGALQQRLQARAQDRNLAFNWLTNLYLDRTFAWSKEFEEKLNALTPEQVTAAMRKYIDPAKITVVKAGDFARVAKGE